MRRRDFISRVLAASAVPIVAGCASSATSTHKVRYIPALAWHQVVGGVANARAGRDLGLQQGLRANGRSV